MPAVAGLTAAGTLMDEDEDAEEKQRRMEAKIAAENFGGDWLRRGRGSGGERKIGRAVCARRTEKATA